MARPLILAAIMGLATIAAPGGGQTPPAVATLPGGAAWTVAMPSKWNGTLLLYSRGYAPKAGTPEAGPLPQRQLLLDAGYAIVASDYGAGGWALAEAVPAQREALAAFRARYGTPKRIIAWGSSMGGLVTTALAERAGTGIDGAVAVCASIGGSLGMMNMALDGAYAFTMLVAADAGIRPVAVDDDRVNGARVLTALTAALTSPEGRARVALAGALAGIPGWTSRDRPAPAATDYDEQAAEIARAVVMGVFLPRTDQEQRAGGVFSWNSDIDYRRQLDLSGRRRMVAALYRVAGLDLNADLARLNAGQRIAADPEAVAYMRANYTPTARPLVPLVAVQTIGDGATSPSMQRAYADAAPGRMVRSVYVNGAGHCTIPPSAILASIQMLESRIETGRWPATPPQFVAHMPSPMLRPCFRGKTCR